MEHQVKRKKIVIISHTEHYRDSNGFIKGWGPTVNEINFLSDYWDEVCHVGCLYDIAAPSSSLPYTSPNIKFVAIPPHGGKRIIDKVLIFFKIPKIIFEVVKATKDASEVQLRLPTSMGLFLLPLFSFFIPRTFTFWVKYAGNWKQEQAPLSYRLQRWWLKKNIAKCAVTINGFWHDQPEHCYSFENPCLTIEAINKGITIARDKRFISPFVFCFVGRLESPKGVDRIIEALKVLPLNEIGAIHFVGDGDKTWFYKREADFLKEKCTFHGFLDNKGVHEILSKTHFFLLPSTASEGFPKVIAEASCYGAIPVVSNVSSVPHYINSTNGVLWDIEKDVPFGNVLKEAIDLDENILREKSRIALQLAEKFTFANYISSLTKILKSNVF